MISNDTPVQKAFRLFVLTRRPNTHCLVNTGLQNPEIRFSLLVDVLSNGVPIQNVIVHLFCERSSNQTKKTHPTFKGLPRLSIIDEKKCELNTRFDTKEGI